MSSAQTTQAIASGDLLDLVSSSGGPSSSGHGHSNHGHGAPGASSTIYPSDDALLSVLHARFRSDLPYTRIGATHLLVVNPYKTLGSTGDAAMKEYEERGVRDTSGAGLDKPLQPHIYEVAGKMYVLMRRKKEAQGVIARGITGSGKSTSLRLLTNQLLHLSAHSKKELALANQIKSTQTILSAFGCAKSLMNASASRHAQFLSLHFSPSKGRIAGAKFLTYNLDKSRVTRLRMEERTFHIFYQFLAGATVEERDFFGLQDVSEYRLLRMSGCYRLPAGPFADDAVAMGETRAALAALGFKPKHLQSIFAVLTCVLLLTNIEFGYERGEGDDPAYPLAASLPALAQAARLLGVGEEELRTVLVTRTRYVKKEVFSVILEREGAESQRDRVVRDLWAILWAWVGEGCNSRIGVNAMDIDTLASTIPIYLLDQPGFQTRGPSGTQSISLSGSQPLVNAYGPNGFEEFTANYADELLNAFVCRHIFDDEVGLNAVLRAEGVALPEVSLGGVGGGGGSVTEGGGGGGPLDERVVEVLRGADVLSPAVVSSSGKKMGGLVGVWARACWSFKSGKAVGGGNRISGMGGSAGGDEGYAREEEALREAVGLFGERYRSVFVVGDEFLSLGHGQGSSIGHGTASHPSSPFNNTNPSSSTSSSKSAPTFSITHYASTATYSTACFVEKDADLLDAAFLNLLRGSSDGFVARLMSGPGVATERHAKDAGIVVQGQVVGRGLRGVGGVLPSGVYAYAAGLPPPSSTSTSVPGGASSGSAGVASGKPKISDVLKGLEGDFLGGREREEAVREGAGALGVENASGVGRLDLGKTYPVLVQLNHVLGEVFEAFGRVVRHGGGDSALERLVDGVTASGGGGGVSSPFDDPAAGSSVSGGAGTVMVSKTPRIKSPGTRLFVLSHVRPNDSQSPNSFDRRRVRHQLALLHVPGIVQRVFRADWVVGVERGAFCERYVGRMRGSLGERVGQCARAEGWRVGVEGWWREGEHQREGELEQEKEGEGEQEQEHVWLTYDAWKGVEDRVRAAEKDAAKGVFGTEDEDARTEYTHATTHYTGGGGGEMLTIPSYSYGGLGLGGESVDNLVGAEREREGRGGAAGYVGVAGGGGGVGYGAGNTYSAGGITSPGLGAEYPRSSSVLDSKDESSNSGVGGGGDKGGGGGGGGGGGMTVKEAGNAVEEVPTSTSRRWWLRIVWCTTFWMPSFLLSSMGRMKRPDVRLAWREKVTIFWLIFLLNAIVIFFIVVFGRLLCPEYDKAWNLDEVKQHQGSNDFYVAIQGVVYDVTNFVKGDHSDIVGTPSNSQDYLEQLAGQDLTYYFPPPLRLACPFLVDEDLRLTRKNFSSVVRFAEHVSGGDAAGDSERLKDSEWYVNRFGSKMREYRKGPVVWDRKELEGQALDENIKRIWGTYRSRLYDLTDYIHTLDRNQGTGVYNFLNEELVATFRQRPGQDVTQPLQSVLNKMEAGERRVHMNCLDNAFYMGDTDFRTSARCQASNYLLIIASVIMMSSMGLKFLAALQLGPKRTPELQDKFVLCQVPCYTEGEESLRRTIDSLAALNYDDKRKLIFIICDGNIIGSGNDRTTPRIALDILGVDPKVDPEPLLFKSVGEGTKALNYGKVYSGLYEFEGHVVPYMVVVKVGKPTERSKPGNRGKRDSQILLMHYLNRVHFDSPMNPLELEIYHQMRNVIGIDPAFYEYIFTIDADTTVTPESLNRLVASSADDSSIIGICGETKLTNEEISWWTMIQVYEYYISHHLSKAFESLFGSVTCLPGCFSLYRIRTADKGRPIIISNRIIEEYAEPNVDTLHKKNLFSLGEDRFLTTLMMKHFPSFKTKFCPDAVAHTMAPESWRVLFSQRRRWINSTVHNLCELVMLKELFGFCCFSMRFFVFIDLLSTLILPATVVYLVYLIIVVATQAAAFPKIAIIMLAIVYGLQAIIFLIKREFMLIGWMVVYIVSYPVYSFFLPVYSFWCMDEFSWGNTRVVVGEGKEKKVLINEEEKFDESMIPLKKFSEYEAEAWETGSRHSDDTGYHSQSRSRQQHGPNPPRSRAESMHGGSAYQHGSQAGDYYRDTNLTHNNAANSNLRLPNPVSGSQHSHYSLSQYQGAQPMAAPSFGGPQLPFMPFAGGPGSVNGSDYGVGGMNMGLMGGAGMGMMPGMMGYQNTGSVYGMPTMMGGVGGAPRNTVMSGFMGNAGGMFGGGGSLEGGMGAPPTLGQQRPMSTFSMATSVNPFAGPSMNPNPTDDELFNALRTYLSTQDLMTVTKKTAREAIMAKFPKADLASKKDFLNQSIDRILSES